MTEQEKIDAALDVAIQYALIDGAHHKMWVIDQMVRALTQEGYSDFVRDAEDGEDGPHTYVWDPGTPP